MKKISLKSIRDLLSRDEMRRISGGSGGGSCNYLPNCAVDSECGAYANCRCYGGSIMMGGGGWCGSL